MKRPIFNSLIILLPLLLLPLANGQPLFSGGWLPYPDIHTGLTQAVATVRTSPFNDTQFAGITPPDDHYIPEPITIDNDGMPFNNTDWPPPYPEPYARASTHQAFAFDPFQEYRPTNDTQTQRFHQETIHNFTQASSSSAPFISGPNLALNTNQTLSPFSHWAPARPETKWKVYDEHLQPIALKPKTTSQRSFVHTKEQNDLHQTFQAYVNSQNLNIQALSNSSSNRNQALLIHIIAETCLTMRLLHAPLNQQTSNIVTLEEAYIKHLVSMDWESLKQLFTGIRKIKTTVAYIRSWHPIPHFQPTEFHFKISSDPINRYNFKENSYRLSESGGALINRLIFNAGDEENVEA